MNETDKRRCVEFSEWAIRELNNEAIFIFSDETYHEIDECSKKKQKFFWSQSISSHQSADSVSSVQFTIMHWGACSEDEWILWPFYCWIYENEQEKKKNNQTLIEENQALKINDIECQKQAQQSETKEFIQMQKINNEIEAHNAAVRKINSNDNCKGIKRKCASRQIFKSEMRKWDEGKEIDWFLYRKRILFFLLLLGFKVQVLSEGALSTIDEISETKVLRDTEVSSLFVFKTAAE